MKVYKIRNKETGLFKKGGGYYLPEMGWSKSGKTWSSLGALKNHIRLLCVPHTIPKDRLISCYLDNNPSHEILEITIEETNTKVIT